MRKKKEIGGEFWDVNIQDKDNEIFPKQTQWYLSGRSALYAIVKELDSARTVFMPGWCCESMVKPFLDAGMEVDFYPVFPFKGVTKNWEKNYDVLLIMDYFGYTSAASDLKGYEGVIIRDVTHSVFSTAYTDADFYFGSLRKWCGVWTGGYAWAKDGHQLIIEQADDGGYTFLREKAMMMKQHYIDENTRTNVNAGKKKDYLDVYKTAENILEKCAIAPSSERDVLLARRVDAEFIKSRRRANARLLMSAFTDQLVFPVLNETDCPMFVPIIVPNGKRNALQKHLIANEVYCPVHWPMNDCYRLDDNSKMLNENELSLVCDQRYTEEDMNHIIETIERFWGDEL